MEFPGTTFGSQHVQKATHSGGDEEEPRGNEIMPAEDGSKEEVGGRKEKGGDGCDEEKEKQFGEEVLLATGPSVIEAEGELEDGKLKVAGGDGDEENMGEEKLATDASKKEAEGGKKTGAGGDGEEEDVSRKDAQAEGDDGGKKMEDDRSSEENGMAKRKWDIVYAEVDDQKLDGKRIRRKAASTSTVARMRQL